MRETAHFVLLVCMAGDCWLTTMGKTPGWGMAMASAEMLDCFQWVFQRLCGKKDDSTQRSQTLRVANIKIPAHCTASVTALNQTALENGNGLRGCGSCIIHSPLGGHEMLRAQPQTAAAGEAWGGQAFRGTLHIVSWSYPRVVYREGDYQGASSMYIMLEKTFPLF